LSITPFVPPATLTSLPSGIWSGADGLPVLPYLPGQTPNVAKAPVWSTKVKRAASGRERRTALWPYPLWQFELTYEVIRHKPLRDELFALWEFFNAIQGRYAPWLFVDPSDCQIPSGSPQTFAVGDGATRIFQLTRSINSFTEPVFEVFAPSILDNGAAAGAYAMGPNGVVTFATAPASGHTLAWYGYFYFGCRFLQDDLAFDQIVSQLWSGASVKFTSLRA
jgi:uncharacterized protein (TIGR02217 family)